MTDQPDFISRSFLLIWTGVIFTTVVGILITLHVIIYHLVMGHHGIANRIMDDWFFPMIWVVDYLVPSGILGSKGHI